MRTQFAGNAVLHLACVPPACDMARAVKMLSLLRSPSDGFPVCGSRHRSQLYLLRLDDVSPGVGAFKTSFVVTPSGLASTSRVSFGAGLESSAKLYRLSASQSSPTTLNPHIVCPCQYMKLFIAAYHCMPLESKSRRSGRKRT